MTISLDQGGYSSLHDLYLIISPNDLMQTEQNGDEYQGTGAIDFVAITEKNKKRYIRIKLSIPEIQGAFSPMLMVLPINE